MPYPKRINDPEVRAAYIEKRRAILAEFDSLREAGLSFAAAARELGVSVGAIRSFRHSVEQLSCADYRCGRGVFQIDLGLAILSCLCKPGVELTVEDIAAWCGCTRSAIWEIERRAMRKLRKRLYQAVQGTEIAEEVRALSMRGALSTQGGK